MVCRRGELPRSFVWPRLAFASVTVGNAAPALVVPELDGQTFDLSALRGKVVIVNFWATWCPPCRKEMPALDAFYRRYHGNGLEMIGVSADRPHDRSDVIQGHAIATAIRRRCWMTPRSTISGRLTICR